MAQGFEEDDVVGNATDFIMGLSNVKTLYLSANTLEVLTHSCNVIPIFNNLTDLTIESSPQVGWESLPGLLKNSPNLETLIFQRRIDVERYACANLVRRFLVAYHQFRLKILKFCDTEKETEQIKYFLETMPNLEKMILYYHTPIPFVQNAIQVSSHLQLLVTKLVSSKVASSKCFVQIISEDLSLEMSPPILSGLFLSWR